MTEHHCPEMLDDCYRIAYQCAASRWILSARTEDHHPRYPLQIAHCPFCGQHLENPEPDITITAPATDWRFLNAFIRPFVSYYASSLTPPTEKSLDAWLTRLENALEES